MLFNKIWKFYAPDLDPAVPEAPSTDATNSLSKNYTDNIDAEKTYAPVSPLEKAFAKMAGDDIDIGTPRNALEYQVKRYALTTPASGGGVPEANEEGLVLTTGTKGNKITIIDTHITTPTLRSDEDPYQGTWAGFDESLIKWPEDDEFYSIIGTIDGNETTYDILNNPEDGHYILTYWGHHGRIRFFPDGTFKAWVSNKAGLVVGTLDSDFFLDIDKIEPVWAPMPNGTVTATASTIFVGSHSDSTLDMTAREIKTALSKGPVFVKYYISALDGPMYQYGIVIGMDTSRDGSYYFGVLTYYNGAPVEAVFIAASSADYPTCAGNTH